MKTENKAYDLSKAFALRIIKLYEYLTNQKHEYILSKQVLKSGTSIGANVSEAIMAQSKADFIAKMHVALKECNETKYWLELLHEAGYIEEQAFISIYADCRTVLYLLISILRSSKTEQKTS